MVSATATSSFLRIALILQRNIYVIKFGQFDPFLSVRLIGGQIPVQVILNNFYRPLNTQRPEGKYY